MPNRFLLGKLDLFHSMEVLFPGIFPYHGKHFHTMELDQTMEIGFSNLFLQYFRYISLLWRRSKFSSVSAESTINMFLRNSLFWGIWFKRSYEIRVNTCPPTLISPSIMWSDALNPASRSPFFMTRGCEISRNEFAAMASCENKGRRAVHVHA